MTTSAKAMISVSYLNGDNPDHDCAVGPPFPESACASTSCSCSSCKCSPCKCQNAVNKAQYQPRITFSGVRNRDECSGADCDQCTPAPTYEKMLIYDAGLTWPADGGTAMVQVACSADYMVGQWVYVFNRQFAGHLRIQARPHSTTLVLENPTGYHRDGATQPPGAVVPGLLLATPVYLMPSGPPKPDLSEAEIADLIEAAVAAEVIDQVANVTRTPCFPASEVNVGQLGKLVKWTEPDGNGERCQQMQELEVASDCYLASVRGDNCQGDLHDEYRIDPLSPNPHTEGELLILRKPQPTSQLPIAYTAEPVGVDTAPDDTFSILSWVTSGGRKAWKRLTSLWLHESGVEDLDLSDTTATYAIPVWKRIGASYRLGRLTLGEGEAIAVCGGALQVVDAPTRFVPYANAGNPLVSTDTGIFTVGAGATLNIYTATVPLPTIPPGTFAARIRVVLEYTSNFLSANANAQSLQFAPSMVARVCGIPVAIAMATRHQDDFFSSGASGTITCAIQETGANAGTVDFAVDFQRNSGTAGDRAQVRYSFYLDGFETKLC